MVFKKVLKNTAYLSISKVFSKLFSLILIITISRYLGVEGIGGYSFVFSFGIFFLMFAEFGFSLLITRIVAKNKQEVSKIFGNFLIIKMLTTIVSIILIFFSIRLFSEDYIIILSVYILGLSYLFSTATSTMSSIFRSFEAMKYEMIVDVVKNIVSIILGIFVLIMGRGLVYLFLCFFFGSFISFIISLTIISKKITKPVFDIQIEKWKLWIKQALPFFLDGLVIVLLLRSSIFMLQFFQGVKEVGLFFAAFTIIKHVELIPNIFGISLYPVFTKQSRNEQNKMISIYKLSILKVLIYGLLTSAVVYVFSNFIIRILFGSEFIASVMTLKLLVIFAPLYYINSINNFFLAANDKQKINLIINLIVLLIVVFIGLITIPKLNLTGAALTTISFFIFKFIIQQLYVIIFIKNELQR